MIYRVVTYDRASEQMKGSLVVPPSLLAKVKKIAGFKPEDDGLGEYPLDDAQTTKIAKVLGFSPKPIGSSIMSSPTIRLTTAAFRTRSAADRQTIFPPFAAANASSGAARPSGLAISESAQGRKLPLPRSALSCPSSTTTRPREITVTGQPLTWRPS